MHASNKNKNQTATYGIMTYTVLVVNSGIKESNLYLCRYERDALIDKVLGLLKYYW